MYSKNFKNINNLMDPGRNFLEFIYILKKDNIKVLNTDSIK